jgi:anti-sigma factor RsiW
MTCDDCRQRIQAWLDGDPGGADGVEAHLAVCPACRALAGAARRLRTGLRAAAAPIPPIDLADRIVAGVLADRRRRHSRRRLLFAGIAVAAAACLVVAVVLPKRGPDHTASVPPSGKADVAENHTPLAPPRNEPTPEPPAAPPSLNENVAEATSAVASLARRTADETLTSGQILLPTVPMDVPTPEMLGPLEPPAQSLREAGEGVATGLGPVTNSARRAFDLFLRDIPPGPHEGKSGL